MPFLPDDNPTNPYMPDRGQQLARLLGSLGAGFSMAGANNMPWWAGIGPAASIYGQSQAADEDRAYRQRQMDENNAYRKLQEEQMRAVIDERKAAIDARKNYQPIGLGVAPSGTAPTGVGMGVPTPPPTMGGGQNVNIPQAATAIGTTESGNNYGAVGPVTNGDKPYGRYQIMGANIGPWTKEALGTEYTPDQFLKDQSAQDAVFRYKFGQYANQYGSPEAAARAWFAGPGGMNNMNAKDVLGTSVKDYGDKFSRYYGVADPEGMQSGYRGVGQFNPNQPSDPIIPPVVGGPPPSVPGPAQQPPSPVVLTGGQAPVPMNPAGQPQGTEPPPPEPRQATLRDVPPATVADIVERARRGLGGMTPEKADALLEQQRQQVQADWNARHEYQMKIWAAKNKDAQWLADYNMKGAQFADEMLLKRQAEARMAEEAKRKGANDKVDINGNVQPGPIAAEAQTAAAKETATRNAAIPFAAAEKLTADEMARYSKEIRPGVEATAGSLPNLYEMKRLANGDLTAGTLADLRIAGSRVLDTLGLKDMPEGAVNTTEFLNRASKNVLSFLQTRALGSGSGISEGDRKFVEQMGAKDAGYTKQELQRLSDIAIQSAQAELKKHDATVGRLKALPGVGTVGDGYWKIDAPTYDEWVKANPAPTPTPATVTPPAAAVRALQMNPGRAADFDAKYGAGAADRVLKGR